MKAIDYYHIFEQQVAHYHIADNIDAAANNPYHIDDFRHLLWEKSWVDTVQWHLEDLVRPEDVDPVYALQLKRRIDKSNQHRTNLVEQMDDCFMKEFENAPHQPSSTLNTETPAWAIDRLSILALKIYHFEIESNRGDDAHKQACANKLATLKEQLVDLTTAIDQLMDDLASGRKRMRLYRQMKMYNDPSLNPMLYKKGQ